MQRRYVLQTIEQDGRFIPRNEPLYAEDFESHYGFSPDWSHEKVRK